MIRDTRLIQILTLTIKNKKYGFQIHVMTSNVKAYLIRHYESNWKEVPYMLFEI